MRRLLVLFYSISCIEEKKCTTKMSFVDLFSRRECSLGPPRADMLPFVLLDSFGDKLQYFSMLIYGEEQHVIGRVVYW